MLEQLVSSLLNCGKATGLIWSMHERRGVSSWPATANLPAGAKVLRQNSKCEEPRGKVSEKFHLDFTQDLNVTSYKVIFQE